jgi:uncharacterized membrane protein YheB (UPF0754 family)
MAGSSMTSVLASAASGFGEPLWVYISIPIAAALVGWATKLLAIKMMFDPVEFKGIRPFLGWQGQIPKRAPKMAAVAVDSMTSTVFKPEELFDRVDPGELASELAGPVHDAAGEIVEAIMLEFQPQLWRSTPGPVKAMVIANVEDRAPVAVKNMLAEMRNNLDQLFDVRHIVVSNLVRDKVLLNSMFRKVGDDAFKFLIKSGWYSGFAVGLVQMLVFGITGWDLALPLFGLLTGGLTDYLALKMIFRPKQERTFLPGVRWQGLFHAKRDKVTEDYCQLLIKDILAPEAIMDSMMTGPTSDKFFQIVSNEIERTIDEQMGMAQPIIKVVGGRQYQHMKTLVAQRVIERIPETSKHIEHYADEQLDLENTVVEKMMAMDADEYENLLRPAVKDDEWIIVAVGAALGFLFGEIQLQVILALAS